MGRSIAIAAVIVVVLAGGGYYFVSSSAPPPPGKSLAERHAAVEETCLQEARDQEIRGRLVSKICQCTMETLKKRIPAKLKQGGDNAGDEDGATNFFRENFEVFEECLEKYA